MSYRLSNSVLWELQNFTFIRKKSFLKIEMKFFNLISVQYSTSIDMWGVGCIYYEMVISKPLFPGQEPADQLERIFKVLGSG